MHPLRKSLNLITIFFLMVFVGVQGILLTHTHSLPKTEVAAGNYKTHTFEIHEHVSPCLICDFILHKIPQNKSETVPFAFVPVGFFISCWSIKETDPLFLCFLMKRQGRAPPENPFS
jgi:hypothetical protein